MDIELVLAPGDRVEASPAGLLLAVGGHEMRLPPPAPGVAAALQRLTDGGASEDRLCQDVLDAGSAEGLFSLFSVLRPLDSAGAVRRRLVVDGRTVATLIPRARDFRFDSATPDLADRVRLSRFAFLQRDGECLLVEAPAGRAVLRLEDPGAARVVLDLVAGCSVGELADRGPGLDAAATAALVALLRNAGAVVDADTTEAVDAGRPGDAGAWWEFHDLLFHMRSRRGRHDRPYGGTYPHGVDRPAPPLVRPHRTADVIALERPDLAALRADDDPFTDVVERRRSIRTYGPEPITREALAGFLYRALRYQKTLTGQGADHALRAAPAGGALHELDTHLVVHRCLGLEAGVYDYDPAGHQLVRLAAPSVASARLLAAAAATANAPAPPDICFLMSARCQRVFWKYESMAYALILKNLGALYATMYLVATAMRLAPCALGGGDSELAASICGLDPLAEPVVGEFLLGSAPPEQA